MFLCDSWQCSLECWKILLLVSLCIIAQSSSEYDLDATDNYHGFDLLSRVLNGVPIVQPEPEPGPETGLVGASPSPGLGLSPPGINATGVSIFSAYGQFFGTIRGNPGDLQDFASDTGSLRFCSVMTVGTHEDDTLKGWWSLLMDHFKRHEGITYGGRKFPIRHDTAQINTPDPQAMREMLQIFYVEENCRLFLGPADTVAANIIKQALSELQGHLQMPGEKVVFISPVRYEERPTQEGGVYAVTMDTRLNNVMVSCLDAALQASMRQGAESLETIAMFKGNNSISEGLCASVDAWANNHGLNIVFTDFVGIEDSVQSEVGRLQTQPDMIILCESGSPTDTDNLCVQFLYALRNASINPKALIFPPHCVGRPDWAREEVDGLGSAGAIGRGVLGAELWVSRINATSNMAANSTSSKEFEDGFFESFRRTTGGDPASEHAARAFASVDLLVHALQMAETQDGDLTDMRNVGNVVANVLERYNRANGWTSIIGSMEFDEAGFRQQPHFAVQHKEFRNSPTGRRLDMTLDAPNRLAAIVGPQNYAFGYFWQQVVWYPKPTYEELNCITERDGGVHGYLPGNFSQGCQRCPLGMVPQRMGQAIARFGDVVLPVKVCESCLQGRRFKERAGNVECEACLMGEFSASRGSLRCHLCETGRYQPAEAQTACHLCLPGSSQAVTGSTECSLCPQGKLAPSNGSDRCLDCPMGSICAADGASYTNEDGRYILLASQYPADAWAKVNNVVKRQGGAIFDCPYDKGRVCKANRLCSADGETTMGGPFCGSCLPGYEKVSNVDKCTKCAGKMVAFALCILNAMWIGFIICVLVVEAYRSSDNQVRCIMYKQVLHYAVMMHSVLEVTNLDIGPEGSKINVSELLQWSRLLGYASPRIFEHAASCQMKYFSSETPVVYTFVTMGHLMVPIWVCMSTVAFLIFRSAVNAVTSADMEMGGPLNAVWLITLYVLHIRITRMLREVFICRTFDASRLLWNPEIFCADADHKKWEYIAGFGVLLWVIGIPLFFLYILVSAHRHHKLQNNQTRKIWGFFYVGFTPDFYFFEPIYMFRGAAFQMLSGLAVMKAPASPVDEEGFQSAGPIVMLIVVAGFIFLQYGVMPYDHRQSSVLNKIEGASLWAVCSTVIAALAREAWGTTTVAAENQFTFDFVATILGICCLTCNLRFLLIVGYAFVKKVLTDVMGDGARGADLHSGQLVTKHLSKKDKKLFCTILHDVTSLVMLESGECNWLPISIVLERLIGETMYLKHQFEMGRNFERATTTLMHPGRRHSLSDIHDESPAAYKKFIGKVVTVGEIYRCLLQYGEDIVRDVVEQLKVMEMEKLRKHSQSKEQSSESHPLYASEGLYSNLSVGVFNDMYLQYFKEYSSALRIGLAHRNKLLEAQSCYRSLGMTKGSHEHVASPRYETCTLTVEIQSISSFAKFDIRAYIKCAIIGEDGTLTNVRSTDSVASIPCDHMRPLFNEDDDYVRKPSFKAKDSLENSNRFSPAASALTAIPSEMTMRRSAKSMMPYSLTAWTCSKCGFLNPKNSETCTGGMMTWNSKISFAKGQFNDSDAIELTVWRDTKDTSEFKHKNDLVEFLKDQDEVEDGGVLLGQCILTTQDLMTDRGDIEFKGVLPVLALHKNLLELRECYLHIGVEASIFEGEFAIIRHGQIREMYSSFIIDEYLHGDDSQTLCIKLGSPEEDQRGRWKLSYNKDDDTFFIKDCDGRYLAAGDTIDKDGRMLTVGDFSEDEECAAWKIIPCQGSFFLMHVLFKEYLCAIGGSGGGSTGYVVTKSAEDMSKLEAEASWKFRNLQAGEVPDEEHRDLSKSVAAEYTTISTISPSRPPEEPETAIETPIDWKAAIESAQRTEPEVVIEGSATEAPSGIRTSQRTVTQAFFGRSSTSCLNAVDGEAVPSTRKNILSFDDSTEIYQKEIDALKAQLQELRRGKPDSYKGRGDTNDSPSKNSKKRTKKNTKEVQTELLPTELPHAELQEEDAVVPSKENIELYRAKLEESRNEAEGLQGELEWLRNSLKEA